MQVAACKDTGYDWFEQLLQNVSINYFCFVLNVQHHLPLHYIINVSSCVLQLLKSEEDASYKPVKKACTQLVDNLVEHILKYEESMAGTKTFCFLLFFQLRVTESCPTEELNLFLLLQRLTTRV